MSETTPQSNRRIVWLNVLTVVSAAILIGAEVFGAAFAGSWAIATLFDLGGIGARVLDALFVLCGLVIMAQFIRNAHRIEPFTARE
jgi:ABC-type dipeptide/oligopeptide/nickel transport system permease component